MKFRIRIEWTGGAVGILKRGLTPREFTTMHEAATEAARLNRAAWLRGVPWTYRAIGVDEAAAHAGDAK